MMLSTVIILDLFIRFASIGQLCLILMYIAKSHKSWPTSLLFAFLFCASSYLLLTAPIPDAEYGWFRGPLLLFTDLTPILLWSLGVTWLNHPAQPSNWPKPVYLICIPILVWFSYFFLFKLGVGPFHDVNHILGFLLMGHLIVAILNNLNDDLDDDSRQRKIFALLFLSAHSIVIILFEFADSSIRDHYIFSLTNALICALATSYTCYVLFILPLVSNDNSETQTTTPNSLTTSSLSQLDHNIPLRFRQDWKNLQHLIDENVHCESGLTISRLAERLAIPPHQLRSLLNQYLGYKNFSQFLNSLRIKDACNQLKDPAAIKTPVLTIALELGYGSIGPFNRAFKEAMALTPTEYRRSFSK